MPACKWMQRMSPTPPPTPPGGLSRNDEYYVHQSRLFGWTGRGETMAKREGFEPSELCSSSVFKTDTIDRSDTSPYGARGGVRTLDMRLKRPLLYQLSYTSIWCQWQESNLHRRSTTGSPGFMALVSATVHWQIIFRSNT